MKQTNLPHPLRTLNFTRDYNVFTNLPSNINRPVTKDHVRTLNGSLKALGSLRAVICAYLSFLDPNKLYVLDGQHLIEASIINGDEIAYVIVEINTKKDLIRTVSMLNSSSKNWTTKDYVVSWSWLIADYRILWEAASNHRIPLSACVCAYSMLGTRDTGPIKAGEFKILDKANGDKLISWLAELYTIVPITSRVIARNFTESFVELYYISKSSYRHAAFRDYVAANVRKLVLLPDKPKIWLEFLSKYKD